MDPNDYGVIALWVVVAGTLAGAFLILAFQDWRNRHALRAEEQRRVAVLDRVTVALGLDHQTDAVVLAAGAVDGLGVALTRDRVVHRKGLERNLHSEGGYRVVVALPGVDLRLKLESSEGVVLDALESVKQRQRDTVIGDPDFDRATVIRDPGGCAAALLGREVRARLRPLIDRQAVLENGELALNTQPEAEAEDVERQAREVVAAAAALRDWAALSRGEALERLALDERELDGIRCRALLALAREEQDRMAAVAGRLLGSVAPTDEGLCAVALGDGPARIAAIWRLGGLGSLACLPALDALAGQGGDAGALARRAAQGVRTRLVRIDGALSLADVGEAGTLSLADEAGAVSLAPEPAAEPEG